MSHVEYSEEEIQRASGCLPLPVVKFESKQLIPRRIRAAHRIVAHCIVFVFLHFVGTFSSSPACRRRCRVTVSACLCARSADGPQDIPSVRLSSTSTVHWLSRCQPARAPFVCASENPAARPSRKGPATTRDRALDRLAIELWRQLGKFGHCPNMCGIASKSILTFDFRSTSIFMYLFHSRETQVIPFLLRLKAELRARTLERFRIRTPSSKNFFPRGASAQDRNRTTNTNARGCRSQVKRSSPTRLPLRDGGAAGGDFPPSASPAMPTDFVRLAKEPSFTQFSAFSGGASAQAT